MSARERRGSEAPSVWLGLGLAFVTSSVLSLEIMLTRIFSVTMWYHFAFLAISVAMFGTSFGAVLVFVRSGWFPQSHLASRLSIVAALFALSIPAALATHLAVPFIPLGTAVGLLSVLATYAAVSVPFTFGGVVVALVLSRFPQHSGRLYAMDLAGASVGCLAVFALMSLLDGPTAAMAASLPAVAAAWMFRSAAPAASRGSARRLVAATAALMVIVAANAATGAVRVRWPKDIGGMAVPRLETDVLVERWNPMCRVVVLPGSGQGMGWGQSPRWRGTPIPVRTKILLIDNAAATALVEFRGNFDDVRFLREDVTALAYFGMPPGGRVAILGVGGGKDVLTALSFKASRVKGIEVNGAVLEVLRQDFRDFTGGLAERADVVMIEDEARSYLARSREAFDVIQASLIDSWAATAAGAFVLTENGLYTVEGWETFLSRLTADGVVTFSRWYVPDQPGELLRLLSVACEAYRKLGVADPAAHMFVAASPPFQAGPYPPLAVATLIASRQPLDPVRVDAYRRACASLEFDVLLAPGTAPATSELGEIVAPASRTPRLAGFPLDLSPATDDRPFFFNMLDPLKAFSSDLRMQGVTDFNIRAVRFVIYLLAALLVLSAASLLLPVRLRVTPERGRAGASWAALVYFAGIGMGFMLIEMGQVQRLSLYLGHPTYALTVVLAGILLSAGLGSIAAQRWVTAASGRGQALVGGAALLAIMAAFVFFTPAVLHATGGSALGSRLALSAVLVGVPGFLMGIPMPFGLAKAGRVQRDRLPWLWAVNGAFSVVGSVVGVVIGIGWGITASMIAGLAFYAAGGFYLATEHASPKSGA